MSSSRAGQAVLSPDAREARRPRAAARATSEGWLAGAERAPLRARLDRFERYFAGVLPAAKETPPALHAAMRYAALGPGKRLRPLLALTACEAVGGRYERALPAAAAVELVHAFSLVHDDLPAMDDDDFRRGRPTTHKRFDEATALLAGDALLALAFETLARARAASPRAACRAVALLAQAAGSRVLVGGQVLDLEGEGRRVSGSGVRDIHLRKTGGLIRAALMTGGLAGNASPGRLRALGAMGLELGLAFQIHDDLLNRRSSLARLGKRAGTDDARGKATYPRAVGDDRARIEAGRLFVSALGRVERLGIRAWNLGHLILAVAERDR
ncbi:MAG: polyprenyl synthetase family protein [Candidatus Eisenbacteria bacterium]|uniref:Polyprenyl synthetase family protein n=1 Tax=Eiseniibacteriota bacterium TaxID=2212470 RepID=A0A9D6QJC4_UNCEI|nr:polyprenyl synthetase family protein [Candidatus Eisenbacteria bacterium]MBI3540367.1 polyprenyl synthetase family protein [Candidatus Eisenbacteria bacterium]